MFLSSQQLPPGYRASTAGHGDVEIRPAATVVLLRSTSPRFEVLLLRRPSGSSFAGGAWVFPGGRVDPGDEGVQVQARFRDSGSFTPQLTAAVRETLEETGLPVGLEGALGPLHPPDAARGRAALLRGASGWDSILEEERWWIIGDGFLPLAQWVTPLGEPRRYDTSFFVARVPSEWRPSAAEGEVREIRWLPPEEALQLNRGGAMPMLFPTVHTLEFLASQPDWEGVRSVLARRKVPRFTPRIVAGVGGARLLLEGLPGAADP